MADFITTFEPGEFEIALVTYNRCDFLVQWLEKCYEQIKKRNIHLSIYDSSTCDDTENYIEKFKVEKNDFELEYYHVDSDINIGYKPMLPILNSKSKYIWVSGDSRYHDFECLDKKIFTYLKQDIDYVVFHIINNEENDGKIYTDKEELLQDCFLSMTCIGLSIYKTSLFEPLKNRECLREECNQKFRNNYAFAWIGYFLRVYVLGEYKSLFSIVPIKEINTTKKVQSWFKRCYGCWVEDLCSLMDALEEYYSCTESVIRDTWKYMGFDSPGFCDYVRKKGDLNQENYKKYKHNGMLARTGAHMKRLETFAYAADNELKECLARVIQMEITDFEKLCYQKVGIIKERANGHKLWIYGAGKGGKILRKCLAEYEIPVYGFLDKNAEKIGSCGDLQVKNLDDVNLENCFIVISLLHWTSFILTTFFTYGMDREKIFFMSVDD